MECDKLIYSNASLSVFNYKNSSCMHAHTNTVTKNFSNEYFTNKHFNSCKNYEMKNKVLRKDIIVKVKTQVELYDDILEVKSAANFRS